MSRIHFLTGKFENDIFEDKNSTKLFSTNSISHSRQGWRNLVQRILNNEFYDELKILQLELNSNVFQRYPHQLTNEYKSEMNECLYKVHLPPVHCLPSREPFQSIFIRVGSLLKYPTLNARVNRIMMIPSIIQFGIVMKLSEIEDQTEREQNKLLIQKRVTIIPPSTSTIRRSPELIEKRNSFVEDGSTLLTSPKWRPDVDEQHFSSLDSHAQVSFPTNQRRPSDDLRQMVMQTLRRNSYQDGQKLDEPLTSFNNFFQRKRYRNSGADVTYDNNIGRLSLRSVSYGFGLGTKTWATIHDRKKISHENLTSSPNYRLPANKIELDRNQQELIRGTGSFKRKSDIL